MNLIFQIYFVGKHLSLVECVSYARLLRDVFLGRELIAEMEVVRIAGNSQETQWINEQLRPVRPGD